MRPDHVELHELLELNRDVAESAPTRSTMRQVLAGRGTGEGRPVRIRLWRNCSVEISVLPIVASVDLP